MKTSLISIIGNFTEVDVHESGLDWKLCVFKSKNAGEPGYHNHYLLLSEIDTQSLFNYKCFKPLIITHIC